MSAVTKPKAGGRFPTLAAILKNRFDAITSPPFVRLLKNGRQMHNDMPMTKRGSKSKPEVELQYGSRSFS